MFNPLDATFPNMAMVLVCSVSSGRFVPFAGSVRNLLLLSLELVGKISFRLALGVQLEELVITHKKVLHFRISV